MIRLYVNYTEVEISQDTDSVLATFSINDVAGVAERRGSFTQDIEIPYTPANAVILQAVPASGSVAYIESNGVAVFSGKLRVASLEYFRNELIRFKCMLYGDNLDFAYLLNQKQLRDISRGASETFVHSDTNIANGIAGKVLFPLVNYGAWENANEIGLLEVRPAISCKWLLTQIFQEIGYTIESDFISTANFADVHLLFTCGDYLCSPAFKIGAEFRVALSADQTGNYSAASPPLAIGVSQFQPDDDSTAPNYDPSNIYDTATFTWQPLYNMPYTIKVGLICTDSPRPVMILSGTGGSPLTQFVTPLSDDGINMVFEVENITLDTGTTYGIGFGGTPSAAFTYKKISYLEVTRSPFVFYADEVNIADCLPKETTQLDFIKGLTHFFNLYYYADVALRRVYIEPRNNYVDTGSGLETGFFPGSSIFSINEIVDISKPVTIETYDNLNESVQLLHGEGDNYVSQIENGTNAVLYSAIWNMETQTTAKPKKSVNPVFGRFSLFQDTYIATEQTDQLGNPYTPGIIMPRLWNADWVTGENLPSKNYDFSAMVAIVKTSIPSAEYKITVPGGFTTMNEYMYAYIFDYPALSGDTFSLAYGNQTDILGNEHVGLFQRYYLRENVSKRGGEVLKIKAYISAWVVNYLNNTKFKTFIEYNGDLYTLQEIRNYVVGDNALCDVILLKERFADSAAVSDIESNDLNCLNNVE